MLRRIVTAFALSLMAVCVLAQQQFVIERIEVRNALRISPRLIAAETLLREGETYSESDVRAAVARLSRLPFLLSASYALENGSAPGRQVLVINVTEMRRFSFLVDARAIALEGLGPTNKTDYDFPDPAAGWTNAAAGVRWSFRDGGVAHFGMTVLRNRQPFGTNYSAYELGYTRYALFGTRLFATVNVRSPVDSLEEKTFTPEIVVGYPLTPSQTVTVDVQDTLFRDNLFPIGSNEFRQLHAQRRVSMAWTYDTTNQPYAPSRGTFVRVEPLRFMADRASLRSSAPPLFFQTSADHLNADGLELAALHDWELSPIHSVFAGVQGGWASVHQREHPPLTPDIRWRPAYEIVKGGYSRALGAARLELEGRLVAHQTNVREAPQNFDAFEHDRSAEVAASWVRRSVWGTLRLGAAYAHGF